MQLFWLRSYSIEHLGTYFCRVESEVKNTGDLYKPEKARNESTTRISRGDVTLLTPQFYHFKTHLDEILPHTSQND